MTAAHHPERPAPLFRGGRRRALARRARPLPVCLYLEVTNRCNLLCETCPRTFEELEPPADMSWELFTRIVDQVPEYRARGAARRRRADAGEGPAAHDPLPEGSRHLRAVQHQRHAAARRSKFQELIDTGLDELRVSLDAADRDSYPAGPRQGFLRPHRPRCRQVHRLPARASASTTPRVSLWLTGLKETVDQLPRLRPPRRARWASTKCICSAWCSTSSATAWRGRNSRCSSRPAPRSRRRSTRPRRSAPQLGVTLDASGATEPGLSLKRADDDAALVDLPAALVADVFHRAWPRAALLHRAVLGPRLRATTRWATPRQQTLREIWNSPAYRDFRTALLGDAPPTPCQNCGLRWSL